MTRFARIASPLGPMIAVAEGGALAALDFTDAKYARSPASERCPPGGSRRPSRAVCWA